MNGFLITSAFSFVFGVILFVGAYFYSEKCDNHDPSPLLVVGVSLISFAACVVSLIIGTLKWCLS